MKPELILAGLVVLPGVGAGLFAAAPLPRPLRAGTELFVDDARLARREGVNRVVHAAAKLARPVLEPDRPWEEGRVYLYGTVHREAATGEFRMWYAAPARMLYATSRDGLHWTKPELDVAVHEGRPTNIVFPVSHGGAVLVDEADPDPARRYKALIAEPIRTGGFRAYHSADGIHWAASAADRVITVGSEVGQAIRDPATGRYFAYIRPYPPRHFPKSVREKRLGAVAVSDDFLRWSETRVVLTPDTRDDAWVTRPEQRTEFYAMHGFAYGGSYLGVVPLFRITRIHDTIGRNQSKYDGPMEGQLIASRDGLAWSRLAEREPVLPGGEEFDRSIMHVATAPLVVNDEVWLYYTGINATHGAPQPPKRIVLGLARWRLDGWVSLDAGAAEGVIETTAVAVPPGTSALEINANVAPGGQVSVELIDAAGRVLPEYAAGEADALRADRLRHRVTWSGRTALPGGDVLRLRFRLRQAALYSYTFVPEFAP
jgi:hypothetical protein